MRILFIGDVIGRPGRDVLAAELPGLRERLALYPEFVGCDKFLSPRVRSRIDAIADSDGYPRSVSLAAGI